MESSSDTATRLNEMIEEKVRLEALLNTFFLLNSSIDMSTVLKNTLSTATQLMKADVGSIALINEERTHLQFVESTDKNFAQLKNLTVPLGTGIAGTVAKEGKSIRVLDVHKDERFYGKIDEALRQTTLSYLCVPLMVDGKVIGTAQIMNRLDGKSFTEEDETLLEGFARQAALAIQNAKLHQIMLKQKAIESELAICGDIQRKLFPEKIPDVTGYEIFGSTVPTREVGGDYYSVIPRQDGTFDAIIGDVSGKGLSASMMVSELHTGIHLLSRMPYPLDRAIEHLNLHLKDSFVAGKFITGFVARLKGNSGLFEYVVAGHPPPYILSPGGAVRQLQRTGMVLGLTTSPFHMNTETINSGELLLAFSDGYSEAQDPDEELFTEEKIVEAVSEVINLPLPEIRAYLDQQVAKFTRGRSASDDATLLLIRKL